jgi:hypothetical protein
MSFGCVSRRLTRILHSSIAGKFWQLVIERFLSAGCPQCLGVFPIENVPERLICRERYKNWLVSTFCYVWDFLIRLIVLNAGSVEVY